MGITSNVDINLTPEERKHEEYKDKLVAIHDEAIAETPNQQYLGDKAIGGTITLPEGNINYSLDDYRTRRNRGDRIIPAFSYFDDAGEVVWVLNDVDGEACAQGYICENCLEWQESNLTTECKWMNGGTCGYKRNGY